MNKRRNAILYFLLYPFFGPLLGYLVVVAVFVAEVSQPSRGGSGVTSKDISDMLQAVGFAYVFGGLQACGTGIYAAWRMAKAGRSSLLGNLGVSVVANMLVVGIAMALEGRELYRLAVFLVPPALFATFVLYWFERYFRTPAEQAKS